MSIGAVAGRDLPTVLLALAEEADCLVVGSVEDPATAAVREGSPQRFVQVAGVGVRAAVAAGIALAGRRAVVVSPADVPARLPLAGSGEGGGLVAVTGDARVASACWGTGWMLVQPARAADTVSLLAEALAAASPVVLRVPAGAAGDLAGDDPCRLGVPRVLRAGTAGLLAASGATAVRLLDDVARMLAGRGIAVQALELHTAAPGEGPGPLTSDRVLLVGDRTVDLASIEKGRWPPGLRAVGVPDDPRGAMQAVAAYLPARR